MDRRLALQVIFNTVDKLTKPLKEITRDSSSMGRAIKSAREQLKTLDAQQKNISSFRDLKRQVQQTSQEFAAQQAKVRDLANTIAGTEHPTRKMHQEFTRAQRAAGVLKQRHQEQQVQLQGLRSKLQAAGISTKDLISHDARLRDQKQQLNKTIDEERSRLEQLNATLKRQEALRERATKMRQSGMNVLAHGAAMTFGAQRLGDTMARQLMPGIDFGAQLSELQAKTRLSKDDPRFKALKAQADLLGDTTAFSASGAAEGQTYLAQAGFSPEAILASMKDVLDLAIAQKTELGRTAEIASNIAGAFKLDPEVEGNFTRIADVLAGTASRANVNLESLGETMKYLGGAEDLGLALEEAAAMAGLLGNIGIQGGQAGTTLRAMLTRFTQPARRGIEAMEEIGLEVEDANGNLRSMPDILRDISDATRDMGNVERKSILQRIFGDEAGSGMAEIVDQMADGGLDDLLDQLKNVQGEAGRMAGVMADNVAGDLDGLQSAWESVGITLHDVNEDSIRGFVQGISNVLRSVTAWMKEHPALVAWMSKWASILVIVIGLLGVIATVAGSAMLISAGLMKAWVGLATAFKIGGVVLGGLIKLIPVLAAGIRMVTAAMMANPVLAAIFLLTAALLLLSKNWDKVKAGAQAFWRDLPQLALKGLAAIGQLILNWNPLGIFYRAFAAVLNWMGADLPSTFTDLGRNLVSSLIGGIAGMLGALKDSVVDMGSSVTGWFKEKLGINSPSRVFRDFGANTMQGYQQGLQRSEDGPLRKVRDFTRRLQHVGAGIALSTASAAATAMPGGLHGFSSLVPDTRPPIASAASSSGLVIEGGIHITVNAERGMDARALGRMVGLEVQKALEQAARQVEARSRSKLQDID